MAEVLAGARDAAQVTCLLRRAEGQPVPALAHLSAVRRADRSHAGVAVLLLGLSSIRSAERRLQQQEDFYLALSQNARDLAIMVDAEGQITYVSAPASRVLGFAVEDAPGMLGRDFVHPDDVLVLRNGYVLSLQQDQVSTDVARVRDAAGAWRWMEISFTNLLDTAIGAVVCNLRDITERVEAETALRASESRYRAIADTTQEGLWVTTSEGRTTYANARMASILGLNVEEMLGRDALSHFTDEVADGVRRRLATRAERGPERCELLYLHPDGSQRTLSVSAAPLPDDAGAVGSLAMVTDITESRRLERELQRSVLHDGLTGLPNRLLALDRLEHALTRETESTAVLFIDLDHLRVLNESRGHDVGDELLVAVAERLVAVAERLRDTAFSFDTVARFGGDAFLVICENVDEMTAQAYAEKLLDNSTSCPSRT